MTVLTDPTPTLYVTLIIAALIASGGSVRYPNRKTRFTAVILITAFILLFAIDYFVESPREQSVRKVNAMVDGINSRNQDALLAHVSESFIYKGRKKSQLASSELWSTLRAQNVRVAVWDFNRDNVQFRDEKTTLIGFMAKGEAGGRPMPMYVRATFVMDPDGQWRIRTLTAHDPLQKSQGSELQIPGLP